MINQSPEILPCQFCSIPTRKIFAQFNSCPDCGILYNLNYQTTSYEDSYFEAEYEKQYGRTYIDDKSNIQRRMNFRLSQATRYLHNKNHPKLLEIGSAAGFFLELATNAGFDARGWEISKYMSEYANEHGQLTIQGDFLKMLENEPENAYDMVCAFYVIEHFQDQKNIWMGLSRILENRGLLIMAVPSTYGPAFHYDKANWLKNHPKDHYVDYSPSGIKKVCSMFGFKLLHIYPEGLHPERFLFGNSVLLKNFYTMIQKVFKFSDTMLIILQKNG